jgi:CheY-like chemotaxis protein
MEDKLKNFHILVIDDDRLVRRLVHDVLTRLGFGNVSDAEDAEKGLAILENQNVDFLICDWRMEGMDGLELTRLIRRAATLANPLLPIIMFTGNAEAHQVLMARDAGVNEYITKPFSVRQLCKHVTEIVDRPREFVMAQEFKGPSRRRRMASPPNMLERRKARGHFVKVGYAGH